MRRGFYSGVLVLALACFVMTAAIITLWPNPTKSKVGAKPNGKVPTLEELLLSSRMQDEEYQQNMDHINEPSQGTVEQQAEFLKRFEKSAQEMQPSDPRTRNLSTRDSVNSSPNEVRSYPSGVEPHSGDTKPHPSDTKPHPSDTKPHPSDTESHLKNSPLKNPLPNNPPSNKPSPQNPGLMEEYYDGTAGPRFPHARSLNEFEDLVIFTIISSIDNRASLVLLRDFVGVQYYLNLLLFNIPDDILEELSWWNGVQVTNIHSYLGLPISKETILTSNEQHIRLALHSRLIREHGHALWIKFGYVIEPERIGIYRAEQSGSAVNILEAHARGREEVMKMAKALKVHGYVLGQQSDPVQYSTGKAIGKRKTAEEQSIIAGIYVPRSIVVEGYSLEKGLEYIDEQLKCIITPHQCISPEMEYIHDASVYSVFPSDPSSHAGCIVDVREEAITSTILVNEVASTLRNNATEAIVAKNGRMVALAFPTTSRGMKKNEDPVFLRVLLPSLISSVTKDEFATTMFTVYVGFDHGDPVFENPTLRSKYLQKAVAIIGDKPVQIKMLQLPNAKRVALLWNLLYLHALREGAEYFYQVNDDLRLETAGWLAYFTSTLDAHAGFGVVGPADYHNGLNCSILTQSMVTPVHYEIFGMLYPVELKDWKSDRWLTYVYQPNDSHCRQDIIANNGAAPTRYQHCEFLSYVIYLEAGKRQIAEWKAKKSIK